MASYFFYCRKDDILSNLTTIVEVVLKNKPTVGTNVTGAKNGHKLLGNQKVDTYEKCMDL